MSKSTHEQIHTYLHLGREQLQAGELAALEAHLTSCTDCQAYAAEVTALQARLTQLMHLRWDSYSPSSSLNTRVQARIRQQRRHWHFWQLAGSALATAALVILVVALGWLVGRVGSLPERPDNPVMTPMVAASPFTPEGEGWPVPSGLATFGNGLKLLAYTLEDNPILPGKQTQATFYWQSREISPTYNLFIHVLDLNNNLIVQTDVPLNQNTCVTTGRFSPGIVTTCLPISLPLSQGQYQVVIGVYDPITGQHLTTEMAEPAVRLTTIEVAPPPGVMPSASTAQPTCPVTQPNGNPPPGERPSTSHHGNGLLWSALPLDGQVLVSPENVQADGSLTIPWPWWRGQTAPLTLIGRRLGALAPPLQANLLETNEEMGFQPSELLLPDEGCWEITGKAGNGELTFVILVLKAQ